jgi:hypothetical protein
MLRIRVKQYRPAAGLALLVAALVMTWAWEGSVAWAERKVSTGHGGIAANQAAASQPKTRPADSARKDMGISKKQRAGQNSSVGKAMRPTKEPSARRAHRRARAAKPLRPQAMLTPKPDVSYHGMFQQPQRYTPHYEHGKGGVPNPNADALLHEHFQELDKNRDGSIDPFERALGRLDLDRDLADHQWQ